MNYKKIYDLFLENKDRFIDKNNNLDTMQKQIIKDFFKDHPASENQIDWNKSAILTYKDFEKIFEDANNTKNALKRASKDNPRLLFENRKDCKIVGENNNFIFVLPLSYEACVWMDSFDCGGAGAKWCIGYEKDNSYYKQYIKNGYIFILAFNKYPTNLSEDLKYMIQVDPIKLENGDYDDYDDYDNDDEDNNDEGYYDNGFGKCWTQDDQPNKTYSLTIEASDRNVENLTGITKEQLIEYGKEYIAIVEKLEKERKIKINIFVYKEVLWKDLPDVVKNSENSLSIKILDPENVVLGDSSLKVTLGYIIRKDSGVKFDFSPSDFSSSKLLDDTESMFYECENLIKMCKLPANIKDASYMFSDCTSLTSIDTAYFTNVTNANEMFSSCTSLVSIDTTAFKNVTNASQMFYGCTSLASITGTAAFTNATNASYMFQSCTSLVSIDTTAFKNVTSASSMFYGCTSLASIDASAFTNVTNASYMFYDCTSLASIDASAFTNVTNASCMFYGCTSLASIDTAAFTNVTYTDDMFSCCESLKEIRFLSGTEYLEQYEKLIMNNKGGLSNVQIENAKMYSSSPVIRFKRD